MKHLNLIITHTNTFLQVHSSSYGLCEQLDFRSLILNAKIYIGTASIFLDPA